MMMVASNNLRTIPQCPTSQHRPIDLCERIQGNRLLFAVNGWSMALFDDGRRPCCCWIPFLAGGFFASSSLFEVS